MPAKEKKTTNKVVRGYHASDDSEAPLFAAGLGFAVTTECDMKTVLSEEQGNEVDKIMDLALDWLSSWDVVGEGADIAPEKQRIASMHRLKEGVIELVCKAIPGAELKGRLKAVALERVRYERE